MKNIILFLALMSSNGYAASITAYNPINPTHTIQENVVVKKYADGLDASVNKVRDSRGVEFLYMRFSNGHKNIDYTIPFQLVCKDQDGTVTTTHQSHQYLRLAWDKTVSRGLSFKVDCGGGNLYVQYGDARKGNIITGPLLDAIYAKLGEAALLLLL